VRELKKQVPNIEIHFLTKTVFQDLVIDNPNIDKVHIIEKSIFEVTKSLQQENFDWVIDLHRNVRTKALKIKLGVKSSTFRKLNYKKWQLVKFKKNSMPDLHIVDRYFEAVAQNGVTNPHVRGEFFIREDNKVPIGLLSKNFKGGDYVVMAIGAQFMTKRLPVKKCVELISKIDQPVVLIGGQGDKATADEIIMEAKGVVINACGKYNLQQSASIVQQSKCLISNDTGMMHIGACFDVPLITIWGSTTPEFGMYPYRPNKESSFVINEVADLSCRPCSKLGHQECPKGHFKCMQDHDINKIAGQIT
jgi:ADP-heptose:LPS heptosyltransferase